MMFQLCFFLGAPTVIWRKNFIPGRILYLSVSITQASSSAPVIEGRDIRDWASDNITKGHIWGSLFFLPDSVSTVF